MRLYISLLTVSIAALACSGAEPKPETDKASASPEGATDDPDETDFEEEAELGFAASLDPTRGLDEVDQAAEKKKSEKKLVNLLNLQTAFVRQAEAQFELFAHGKSKRFRVNPKEKADLKAFVALMDDIIARLEKARASGESQKEFVSSPGEGSAIDPRTKNEITYRELAVEMVEQAITDEQAAMVSMVEAARIAYAGTSRSPNGDAVIAAAFFVKEHLVGKVRRGDRRSIAAQVQKLMLAAQKEGDAQSIVLQAFILSALVP